MLRVYSLYIDTMWVGSGPEFGASRVQSGNEGHRYSLLPVSAIATFLTVWCERPGSCEQGDAEPLACHDNYRASRQHLVDNGTIRQEKIRLAFASGGARSAMTALDPVCRPRARKVSEGAGSAESSMDPTSSDAANMVSSGAPSRPRSFTCAAPCPHKLRNSKGATRSSRMG
jgi:hypothetical protein